LIVASCMLFFCLLLQLLSCLLAKTSQGSSTTVIAASWLFLFSLSQLLLWLAPLVLVPSNCFYNCHCSQSIIFLMQKNFVCCCILCHGLTSWHWCLCCCQRLFLQPSLTVVDGCFFYKAIMVPTASHPCCWLMVATFTKRFFHITLAVTALAEPTS